MNRMKNAVFFALTVFGLVSASFLLVFAPINAQTTVQTSISIALKPNPIGVGQMVAFEFQVIPAPLTSNDPFVNLTATVTFPSGFKTWHWPVSTNATGGATLFYSFNQTGNYVFSVDFPGQSFKNGQVYAPSKNESALVIQAEPVETPIAYPTPNPAPTNPPAPTWPISPEFTATLNRASYNVTNYLTNEILQQVDNSSIDFQVKNQPLTGALTSIYYLVRIYDPSTGYTYDMYTDGTYRIQSNTTYTHLWFMIGQPYSLPSDLLNATSIDFQIQAQTNLGKSDWSTIQTVYLTEIPSPFPTAAPIATLPPATPTPTPKPTWSPPPRIEANTTSGLIVRMTLAGNVTPSQFSNITLTNESDQAAQLSFVLSGQAGNTGFGNVTVPKTAVCNAASIAVLIDGQRAQNQGYCQNANYYYVWFTTHFSTHQVSIVFATTTTPTTPSSSGLQNTALSFDWIQLAILVFMGIIVVAVVLVAFVLLSKRRGTEQTEPA
jgi:hypothetical protein